MPTSRIYQKPDGRWYYARRGNIADGPHASRRSAETALRRYLRGCEIRAKHALRISWPRTWNPLRMLRRRAHPNAASA